MTIYITYIYIIVIKLYLLLFLSADKALLHVSLKLNKFTHSGDVWENITTDELLEIRLTLRHILDYVIFLYSRNSPAGGVEFGSKCFICLLLRQ